MLLLPTERLGPNSENHAKDDRPARDCDEDTLNIPGLEDSFLIPTEQRIVLQNLNLLSLSVLFFCSCDKVYNKQEVGFLFYLLVQTVTWQ